MKNKINISQIFKEKCKNIKTTKEHQLSILNLTKSNLELIDYLKSMQIKCEEKSPQGKTSTNQLSLEIELSRHSQLKIEDIIQKGDLIQVKSRLADEEIILFTGYVAKFPSNYENLKHNYSITVYDKIYEGIKGKFPEDKVMTTMYLCNSKNKKKSIAHQLAYQMGFLDTEIKFEDIRDITGVPLIAHYIYWKKGEQILAEFTKLAAAVNGKLYVNNEGKLVFSNPYNNEDFTDINFSFNQNILGALTKELKEAEYDGVKIVYDEFKIEDEQVVWRYIEDDQDYKELSDKANILIDIDDATPYFKMKYKTPIVLELQDEPVTLFEYYNENENLVEIEGVRVEDDKDLAPGNIYYILETNNTEGKLKFINKTNKLIYIQHFHILGKPLTKIAGNEASYSKLAQPEKELEITNKYIQNPQVAGLNAQYSYYLNCQDRYQYSFDTYYSPFLALSNKVKLNSLDVNDSAIITNYTHQIQSKERRTTLVLEEYQPFEFSNDVVDSLKARPVDHEALERLAELKDLTTIALDTPTDPPTNLKGEGARGVIELSWDQVPRDDVKGYNVYISSTLGQVKRFTAANSYIFNADPDITYSIQVSAVTIKELESEKSNPITATTTKVPWVEIEIPEDGIAASDLSKSLTTEINQAVQTVDGYQGALNAAKTRLDNVEGTVTTHSSNISTLEDEIALTAKQEELNSATGRLTTAESQIKANAKSITSKISTEEFNTLNDTVVDHETRIEQTEKKIEFEVGREEFTDLTESVEATTSQVRQLADEYTVKIESQANGENPIVTGFGLALNDDKESEFAILADRFKIFGTKDDKEGKTVFAVDTDKNEVYLVSDLIADGTISAKMLASEKLITNAAQIDDGIINSVKIGKGEIKSVNIGKGQINSAHIDYLTADKIIVGKKTKYEDGYDPTEKAEKKELDQLNRETVKYKEKKPSQGILFHFRDNMTSTDGIVAKFI